MHAATLQVISANLMCSFRKREDICKNVSTSTRIQILRAQIDFFEKRT